jgi:plastocyanin
MKRVVLLFGICLLLVAGAFAQSAFTLAGSEKKTLKYVDLTTLKKEQTMGKKEGTNLVFTQSEVRLVATTGPEDDMLSYRIQGVRNPTLVVPANATLKILFVNTDSDMVHDMRFGELKAPFESAPGIAKTVGTAQLASQGENETLSGEDLTIKVGATGEFTYFCSVRGHAKGGMWGNIAAGVKPQVKAPEKPAAGEMKHDHHGMNMPGDSSMSGMNDGKAPAGHFEMMSSSIDLNSAMSKEGSGTSWLPESSPVHAYMKMYDDGGMLMVHGTAFLRYTQVGSERDVSAAGKGARARFDAPSMLMVMYTRPVSGTSNRAQFGLRAMVSLDPLIERGYGYPLLYQSGETYRGGPLHDRQHPHDLIDELAATFSYKVSDRQSFYFYGGVAGEPALGPPSFMHRPSGVNNPDAPLSHHWQDSTHITYGVVTAGYSFGKVKFEASAFNGREPNENRWNIDKPRLNSYSGRVSFNPTKDLSLQISHGYVVDPERAEPDVHILRRTTASAIYNKNFSEQKNWASSFIWGQNYANGERTNAFLFESDLNFYRHNIFGRLERVQKSGHELALDPADEHGVFWVGAYSLGYVYDVVQGKGIDVGLGSQVTFNQNPSRLGPYYGGTSHQGFQFFVRFRPSKMSH